MTTPDRILAAAMELFGTNGYEATSIRQIADRCGLTDAAVLYHFGSKPAILESLWETLTPPVRNESPPQAGTLSDQVSEIIDNLLTATARRDPEIRLMVRQSIAGDAGAIQRRMAAVSSWKSFLQDVFEQSCDSSEAARRADALMMLVVGWIIKGQIDYGDAFPQQCLDEGYRQRVKQLAMVAGGFAPRNTAAG